MSTLGGGATTAGCGAEKAGAERETCRSGGGVTTDVLTRGPIRLISAAGLRGAGGISSCGFSSLSDQATMLGSATSCFSLMFGGVTIVCERLSASGGTEMIGCGA